MWQDIDVIEYLNRTHRNADFFLVDTQKHNIEKQMKELNEQLHFAFISKSEALLSILETYQLCQDTLFACQVPRMSHEEPARFTDETARELSKFKNKFTGKFTESIEQFITPERRWICDGIFNEGRNLVVLTNDLLFIGEALTENEKDGEMKYEIENIAKIKHTKIKKKDKILRIECPANKKYKLKGERAHKLYEKYLEIIYEGKEEKQNEKEKEREQIDDKLLEYLLETEQMEKIRKYVEKNKVKDKPNIMKGWNEEEAWKVSEYLVNIDELWDVLELHEERAKSMLKLVIVRFKEGVGRINKIQELAGIVNDGFDYLEIFVQEIREAYLELEIEEKYFILAIEEMVSILFDSLENRLFSRAHEMDKKNKQIELIRKRLSFDGYNFEYMLSQLNKRRNEYDEKSIEQAQDEICSRLVKLGL